ncbi:serine/threonine-protein phosphatase 4 regulatory subunit 3A [Eurytemora carolleeae]|uniref:serine/threonine-protein phosphatase 4 regulatory subunit 3A n=1 Tax=Eurytemora carolleeae TaxID=1294199 RepID=UPI000C75B9AF|nr:serine/threonine-protein phosphatase 4 regulatory subunit 3A [Eurytemora carolleeae]|eukprot:XP_023320943.1 serine/threonine-protein phosphatase 4 regulatory subunit 3A-like [Eurytemora affinis]
MTDTRKRVKLYELNQERQWDDKGTGHVSSTYVERLKGVSLVVRSEADGSVLLESKIQPETAYQKQQETLIVWSEGDNFDLALSFQEKAGCDEIWEKICSVQGKDPSVDFTQDLVEESEDDTRFDDISDSQPPIELPAGELSKLEEISELVSSCLSSPLRREKLANAIENENYIKKLLNIFSICEDLENLEGLHHLYQIFRNIFLLNKNALFEMMFSEETIFDVVGCLEFEPGTAQPKKHREYLKSIAKFHQVIPITNTELLSKIHQTYRVQYIQDVVLPTPSVFEENILSTLNSFVFFNKVEIVSLILEDERFLGDLFTELRDSKASEERRKELVLFLKEFCQLSQTLQPQSRESFYKTLSSLGVLAGLEMTLQSTVKETKAASVDILLFIVDYSPSLVREYMMQQINNTDDDGLLMNIVIEGMICDTVPDMGASVQLQGIIKTLLDPENMLASVNKSEKTDFLNHFYKHCMHVFVAPLLSSTVHERPEKCDSCTVQVLGLIIELLTFFVEHHTYHIKNYILHKDLLRRILVLIKSRHTFLKLFALRFMRKIIGLKDEFYNRYIIKVRNFYLSFNFFKKNDNIFQVFDLIKTFKTLKLRYDQHQDRIKDRGTIEPVTSILRGTPGSRFRRDERAVDEDEEMWFNEDEDELDENIVGPSPSCLPVLEENKVTQSTAPDLIPTIDRLMEQDKIKELAAKEKVVGPDTPNGKEVESESETNAAKRLGSLVDYDSDSDDEPAAETEDMQPQAKKIKAT